jgi:hypothetical protein
MINKDTKIVEIFEWKGACATSKYMLIPLLHFFGISKGIYFTFKDMIILLLSSSY